LHESGCFVIPNPWDVGGAHYLQGLGFKAIATSSAGYAWSLAKSDGDLSLDMTLAHMRAMAQATNLPVNADFEDGFADDPDGVAANVSRAIETGVAGLSIEDSTGDASNPLRSIEVSVARLRAARRAIDEAGGDTLLVGRAENFFVGRPDLDDTIARLKAYAEAGADCLYAPGISTREQIAAVVAAVAPKPVNVLVGSPVAFTLQDIADLGVRRVSLGGALAASAWGGFMRAARSIAEQGRFDGFANAASGRELNNFFRLAAQDKTMKLSAQVLGKVEYREGDGGNIEIRPGPVQIETTPADATFDWTDGDWRGSAAMPFANFCRYLTEGVIKIDA
jgi:2-methylisocitrate lyase-like PEP mutase family enzyme